MNSVAQEKEHLGYSAPEITDKTFNMVLGSLSQSIFHYDSMQALTATSAGNIVLWDKQTESVSSQPIVRKAMKIVFLQKEAITVLTLIDSFIVTGDVSGQIKFYDGNLSSSTFTMSLAWIHQIHLLFQRKAFH
ncbi:cilia- and flagella-associated protein 251-like [Pimephales promelas]|uniref:cilia- and flagella-associated protein 251-like n=1 Tax=Pimephales promelas TaxID=90988 RepID=UPI001955AD79|nr:cilia- and flagella-associated protein 251-like [Pimephales promelas]